MLCINADKTAIILNAREALSAWHVSVKKECGENDSSLTSLLEKFMHAATKLLDTAEAAEKEMVLGKQPQCHMMMASATSMLKLHVEKRDSAPLTSEEVQSISGLVVSSARSCGFIDALREQEQIRAQAQESLKNRL